MAIRDIISSDAYEKMQKETESKGTTISGLTRMIILERHANKKEYPKPASY